MTGTTMVRPFIARFATPLGDAQPQSLRYDEHRQISQVLVDGIWRDAMCAGVSAGGSTRITRVQLETTDDE